MDVAVAVLVSVCVDVEDTVADVNVELVVRVVNVLAETDVTVTVVAVVVMHESHKTGHLLLTSTIMHNERSSGSHVGAWSGSPLQPSVVVVVSVVNEVVERDVWVTVESVTVDVAVREVELLVLLVAQ